MNRAVLVLTALALLLGGWGQANADIVVYQPLALIQLPSSDSSPKARIVAVVAVRR